MSKLLIKITYLTIRERKNKFKIIENRLKTEK